MCAAGVELVSQSSRILVHGLSGLEALMVCTLPSAASEPSLHARRGCIYDRLAG